MEIALSDGSLVSAFGQFAALNFPGRLLDGRTHDDLPWKVGA